MARRREIYGVYGTSWTDTKGNLWYKIYGDNYKHDTLWTIAQHFYGDPMKYKLLYQLNKDKIADPHWIYPHHTILIKKAVVPPKIVYPPAKPKPKPAKVPAKWTGGDFMEDKPTVTVSKEEYVIGVYDTNISSSEYEDRGCIVVTPTFDDESIRQITMTSDETHPIIDARYFSSNTSGRSSCEIITSLEYYVSIGQSWVSIMPSNIDRVLNEKMFVGSGKKALLRFKADTSYDTDKTMLYADAIQVPNLRTEWSFDSDKQSVIIHTYDSSKSYTMDYVPLTTTTLDPKTISITEDILKSKLKNVTETFTVGTDANMKVRLDHSPYLNTNVIYGVNFDSNVSTLNPPVTVRITNANFVDKNRTVITSFSQDINDGNTIHLKNITNYVDKSIPSFTSFDAVSYPFVEFYHSGTDLFFSEPFKYGSDMDNILNGVHGEGTINVAYQYPEITIKIKVVSRRTTNAYDRYVTPVLNSLRIDAKSIK